MLMSTAMPMAAAKSTGSNQELHMAKRMIMRQVMARATTLAGRTPLPTSVFFHTISYPSKPLSMAFSMETSSLEE